jgi:excisionase family DNA binding protein
VSSNIYIQRICQHCGNEFTARTTVTKYCGDNCAKRAYKARKRQEKVNTSNKEVIEIKNKPINEIKEKEYLSVHEVCTLLGISRRTIYRMIDREELVPGKIGRRTIIPKEQINQLFKTTT